MLYPSELQPRFDNSLILYGFGGRREIFRTFKNMHCSRNVVVSDHEYDRESTLLATEVRTSTARKQHPVKK